MEWPVESQEERDKFVHELTRRMATGSEAAFGSFYEIIFDKLFRQILALTRGDEELSKEIAQAVWLRVARYVRPFENERVLWSWLRQVVRSCQVDLLRKR